MEKCLQRPFCGTTTVNEPVQAATDAGNKIRIPLKTNILVSLLTENQIRGRRKAVGLCFAGEESVFAVRDT